MLAVAPVPSVRHCRNIRAIRWGKASDPVNGQSSPTIRGGPPRAESALAEPPHPMSGNVPAKTSEQRPESPCSEKPGAGVAESAGTEYRHRPTGEGSDESPGFAQVVESMGAGCCEVPQGMPGDHRWSPCLAVSSPFPCNLIFSSCLLNAATITNVMPTKTRVQISFAAQEATIEIRSAPARAETAFSGTGC